MQMTFYSLPPMEGPACGGDPSREGDHEVVEGACVTWGSAYLHCHALSLSRLRRQLPPGGSLPSPLLLPI